MKLIKNFLFILIVAWGSFNVHGAYLGSLIEASKYCIFHMLGKNEKVINITIKSENKITSTRIDFMRSKKYHG